jgi:hypothetical protein
MNTGLIGTGYWGQIIKTKLIKFSNLEIIQNSKNLDLTKFNNIDWVFIATPVETHYNLTKMLINCQINVFVEKPFCLKYLEAKELVEISNNTNKKIYIDNLFLFRTEFISNKVQIFQSKFIQFVWHKNGPFKSSLIDDLLYHDLYMLVELFDETTYSDLVIFVNEMNILKFNIKYSGKTVVFNYNRSLDYKIKEIICDDLRINFLNDNQDPLSHSIKNCLNNNINFIENNNLNLKTMFLFENLKNNLIND